MKIFLVLLLMILLINTLFSNNIYESFDGNCVASVSPTMNTAYTKLFHANDDGSIQIGTEGNAVYNDNMKSDVEWTTMVKSNLNKISFTMDEYLKNPGASSYYYKMKDSCNYDYIH